MSSLLLHLSRGGALLARLATDVDRASFHQILAGLQEGESSYVGLGLGLILAAGFLLLSATVGKWISGLLEKTRQESSVVDFSLFVVEADEYFDEGVLMEVMLPNVDFIEEESLRAKRSFLRVDSLPAIEASARVET